MVTVFQWPSPFAVFIVAGGAANKAGSDSAPPTLTSAILDAQIQAHHSRAGTVKHSQDRAPQSGSGSSPSGLVSSSATQGTSGGSASSAGTQVAQVPAGGGGTVQRPTRLIHPEKLISLASSSGQMQKPREFCFHILDATKLASCPHSVDDLHANS